MVLVLGVSAGAGGARAMLTHSDQPHLPPIDRCTVARRARSRVDEPVFQVIRLMRHAAAKRGEIITGITVTCRSALHEEAIRAAAGRSRLNIVDEPLAQLRYLRFTGQLPEDGTVVLYDLGASGLTLTQMDCRTEAILGTQRSTVIGGDSHDALLRRRLAQGGVSIAKQTSRYYKEELSSSPVLTAIDPLSGDRMVLTRSDFNDMVAAGIQQSVSYVRRMADGTGMPTTRLALLGGCLRNPDIRDSLTELLGIPVVNDPEPEFVSARGAVLMAARQPATRRVRGVLPASLPTLRPNRNAPVSKIKIVAALAVTATLGGTVAGLLIADRDSPRTGTPAGTAPSPLQIAGTPADRPPAR